jgi:hypothetical protein
MVEILQRYMDSPLPSRTQFERLFFSVSGLSVGLAARSHASVASLDRVQIGHLVEAAFEKDTKVCCCWNYAGQFDAIVFVFFV